MLLDVNHWWLGLFRCCGNKNCHMTERKQHTTLNDTSVICLKVAWVTDCSLQYLWTFSNILNYNAWVVKILLHVSNQQMIWSLRCIMCYFVNVCVLCAIGCFIMATSTTLDLQFFKHPRSNPNIQAYFKYILPAHIIGLYLELFHCFLRWMPV